MEHEGGGLYGFTEESGERQARVNLNVHKLTNGTNMSESPMPAMPESLEQLAISSALNNTTLCNLRPGTEGTANSPSSLCGPI